MVYPIIIYFDPKNECSRKLRKYMKKKDYQYSKIAFDSEEAKIAMKYHGQIDPECPVLQIGKMFFHGERLYDSTTMKMGEIVKNCLKEHAVKGSDTTITNGETNGTSSFRIYG